MIKVWWVIWYFTHFDGGRDTSVPSWYDDSIKRGHLHFHLIFNKNFREDYRDTCERWYANLFHWQIPQSPSRKKRIEKRFLELNDIIDKAVSLGYLTPVSSAQRELPSDVRLACTYKGREFLGPIHFGEALAREFGYTSSIVTSFVFGGGLAYFASRVMNF